jgi:hypothetical protein
MNPQEPQTNIEARLTTMRVLWIAMFLSLGLYYVLSLFVPRSEDVEPNATLSLVLAGVALTTTLISFPIKSKLLARAVDQQQVQLVQQAYILALALAETGGMLGLVDYFATGNRYYYAPLIIAACGQLLHFPRREHVTNASFKGSSNF